MQAGRYLKTLSGGVVAAVGIGLAVVAICNGAIAASQSESFASRWNADSLGQVFQIAIPFLLLALLGIRDRAAWIVGILVTAGLWGFLYLPAAMEPGGGANIGWGLLSLVMPFLVFGCALLGLMPRAARGE